MKFNRSSYDFVVTISKYKMVLFGRIAKLNYFVVISRSNGVITGVSASDVDNQVRR